MEVKAVTIAWNANPEVDLAGYRLFWGETNSPATVREVGKTNRTQITNLIAGRTYYFRLTAYTTAGLESNPSTTVYYTQPQPVPAAPSNLVGVVDPITQIRLNWRDNSTNEAGFRVLRKAGVSGSYTTNLLAANTTFYTDTGLTAGTQYFYKVGAYNSFGNSADSAEISFTTPSGPPPTSVNTAASFVSRDSATLGSWRGTYGLQGGLAYPYGSFSPPSYVQIAGWQNFPLTWAASTMDQRALQTTSGTNRFAAAWQWTDSFFFYLTFRDTAVHQVSFYFIDFDRQGRQQKLEFFDHNTGELLAADTISDFENGIYSTWNLQGTIRVKVTRLSGPNCVLSAFFFDPIPASATFVGKDTTTSGSWRGIFGSQGGLAYPHGILAPPSYVQISASENNTLLWSSSTSDTRALQRPSGTDRFAGGWNSTNFLHFYFHFMDTNTHQVSFYFLDYERLGRQQKLEIFDDVNGRLLASTTLSNFQNGVYYSWNFCGQIRMKLTRLSGPDCVLSGLFFDPEGPATASFLAADNSTSGTWKGAYGFAGQLIAAETPAVPVGASVTFSAMGTWVWNSTTTNPAALQRPVQPNRIASAWYSQSQFTAFIDFNDWEFHVVSFYFVDFDNFGRQQLVELVDPVTGTVLDSTELANFRSGVWLRYIIRDRVNVRITCLNTKNAALSGVFFDQ